MLNGCSKKSNALPANPTTTGRAKSKAKIWLLCLFCTQKWQRLQAGNLMARRKLLIPLHLGPDSVDSVVSTFFEANTNLQRGEKIMSVFLWRNFGRDHAWRQQESKNGKMCQEGVGGSGQTRANNYWTAICCADNLPPTHAQSFGQKKVFVAKVIHVAETCQAFFQIKQMVGGSSTRSIATCSLRPVFAKFTEIFKQRKNIKNNFPTN